MKNILLIISLFAICVGVKGQTMKGDVRPEVLIETTMGNIRVELYNETPLHRDNFLKLIREDHFYDSLLFHRVIPDFMIQSTADGRARRDCSGDVRIWKNSSATVSG